MNTLTRVVSGTRAGYAMGTALVLLLAGAAPGQTAQSKPT